MNCNRMTILAGLFLSLGATLTINTAKADPGQQRPSQLVDNDGDGYFSAVPETAFPTKASGGTFTGIDITGDGTVDQDDVDAAGQLDCKDGDDEINPGAQEIPGDGKDNDCQGGDDALRVSADPEVRAWQQGSWYRGRGQLTKSQLTIDMEACDLSSLCEIDTANRTFLVRDPEYTVGYYCAYGTIRTVTDGTTGDSLTHCTADFGMGSGIDIIPVATAQGLKPQRRSGGGGVSRQTVNGLVVDYVDTNVNPRLDALEDGQTDLTRRMDESDLRDDQQDVLIAGNAERVDTLTGLVVQTGRLAQENSRRLDLHESAIGTTQRDGVYFAALASGGVLGMKGVRLTIDEGTDDEQTAVLRNPTLGGGGFGLMVGSDKAGYRYGTYGTMLFGSDGAGEGLDTSFSIGADLLFDVGGIASIGPSVGYRGTFARATVVDTMVTGNSFVLGPTVLVQLGDNPSQHGLLAIRPQVGFEGYGSRANEATPGSGAIFGIEVGIGYGTGSLQR